MKSLARISMVTGMALVAALSAAEVTAQPRSEPALRPSPNSVLDVLTPQPGGLRADEVARRAKASSNTIAAKNAELRAAAAKVDSAMYQFLPRATLKASYSRVNPVVNSLGSGGGLLAASGTGPFTFGEYTTTDPRTGQTVIGQGLIDENGSPVSGYNVSFPVQVNTYSLSASLSVPLSDYVLRMANSIDGTKLNREAAELSIKAERAKVEGDARIAFFNWARALGQVAITSKSLERVEARSGDVEASFKVGMATRTDLLRLQAQVAATEAALESARGFRNLAAEQLAVIMHDSRADYALGEDVRAGTSGVPAESLDALVAEAQQSRLELKALQRNTEALAKAESVTRAGRYPKVEGFADFTYAKPNQRYMLATTWKQTWAVGVQATWAFNDTLTSQSSSRELAADREALQANRAAVADAIRLEVTSADTERRRASAELVAAQRAADASQAAYDTAIQLYKVGKATTSELIDAESELVGSNLRLIHAHIDVRVAETKLARAAGRDFACSPQELHPTIRQDASP